MKKILKTMKIYLGLTASLCLLNVIMKNALYEKYILFLLLDELNKFYTDFILMVVKSTQNIKI